jgi:diguanylate cyclase (GGDEF)-like protein
MLDPLLRDEPARIAALQRLGVLDTAVEEPFEKIVTLVRTVLAVPMATVTLVDRDRQWFKAKRGLESDQTPRSVSFCTHTIQQREPLIVEDADLDPRFAGTALVAGPPHVKSYAGIPLRTPEGYNVGSLCAMDTRPRRFSPADVAILANFASIVCDELELRMIAQVDQLTGALTRRGFVEQAEREIARARRYSRSGTLVMLDLDHFKTVNDTHGHAIGDRVLQKVAEIIRATLRPSDVFGRLGGEEFGILLPETAGDEAAAGIERLRHAVATQRRSTSQPASVRRLLALKPPRSRPG